MGALAAAALAAPVGVLAGRLARRAADLDRARRSGAPPTTGWAIELATAAILAALAARFGVGAAVAPYLVVVTALVAVTVTDVRDHRVPNRVIYPSMAASAATMAAAAIILGEPQRLGRAAIGAAAFSGALLAVHLIHPRGLGRGDVKLAVVLGAALGWLGPQWPEVVVLVAWALATASALGLVLAALAGPLLRSASTPPPAAQPPAARLITAQPAPQGAERSRPAWSQAPVPFAPALSAATLGVVLLADVLVR